MHLWEVGGQVVTQEEYLIYCNFLAKLSVGAFIHAGMCWLGLLEIGA